MAIITYYKDIFVCFFVSLFFVCMYVCIIQMNVGFLFALLSEMRKKTKQHTGVNSETLLVNTDVDVFPGWKQICGTEKVGSCQKICLFASCCE